MRFILALLTFVTLGYSGAPLQPKKILKVSVASSGAVQIDGKQSNISTLKKELENLSKAKGGIWYYRENASAESSQKVNEIFQMIISYRLPISLSSKPDFSDYIDEQGISHPRQ